MRVRTTGEFRRAVAKVINGTYVSEYETSPKLIGTVKTTIDNYPYPKQNRDQLIRPMNPFTARSVKCWCSKGVVYTAGLPQGWALPVYSGEFAAFGMHDTTLNGLVIPGTVLLDPDTPSSVSTSVVDRREMFALVKAQQRIDDTEVQLANTLVEIGQIFATLVNPLKAFRRGWVTISKWRKQSKLMRLPDGQFWSWAEMRTVRRGSASKAAASEAADRWLEFNFGILPTWEDIKGTLDLIESKVDDVSNRVRVSKGSSKLMMTDESFVITTGITPQATVLVNTKLEQYLKATAGIYFVAPRPNLPDKLQGGFQDLFGFLWEATPWTWLLDYVISIGPWLNSLQKIDNVTLLGNYCSVKFVTRIKMNAYMLKHLGMYSFDANSNFQLHREELVRRVNVPLPSTLVLNENILKLRRILNTVSVAWQKSMR